MRPNSRDLISACSHLLNLTQRLTDGHRWWPRRGPGQASRSYLELSPGPSEASRPLEGLRILYLHQHYRAPSEWGGTRSHEFAERLTADGAIVTVVSGGAERPTTSYAVSPLGIQYQQTMGQSDRLRSFLAFAEHATKYSVSADADVVIATSTPLTVAIPALIAKLVRGTPFIFEVRDLWPTVPIAMGQLASAPIRSLALALERASYHWADTVIALSPAMADHVLDTVNGASPVRVITNAADSVQEPYNLSEYHLFLESVGLDPFKPIILYAGSFGRVNDVQWLIALVHELASLGSDAQLLLIGDGSERAHIQRLIDSEAAAASRIALCEPVPKADIWRAFASATIATSVVADIPELADNSANKVFDAMAAGKPILINHAGWLRDLVHDADIGLAVTRDVTTAAAEVDAFLRDKHQVALSSSNSARLGDTTYSRDVQYCRLRDLLLPYAKKVGS